MFSTVKDKLQLVVTQALRQGWSRDGVARASAWGVAVGVFPIYGVTTAALGVIGVVAHLNHAVLQAFNYLVSPLKFLLIIPYIRLGEFLFREENPFRLSIPEFTERFQAAPWETLSRFSMTFVHAIAAWAVTFPVWMVFVYLVMTGLIRSGQAAHETAKEFTKEKTA
ncbi:MAG: DUF2062 domain-containing protein [Verrucomicrobia bacterium]|nr:DUF2062 domain-containing protein [Verrucomicrobiota bacterium]MCH8512966.1 DUF2062 domain-containing protein [Kiritimatiellia bacterium]